MKRAERRGIPSTEYSRGDWYGEAADENVKEARGGFPPASVPPTLLPPSELVCAAASRRPPFSFPRLLTGVLPLTVVGVQKCNSRILTRGAADCLRQPTFLYPR